jgi:hypothetical protein
VFPPHSNRGSKILPKPLPTTAARKITRRALGRPSHYGSARQIGHLIIRKLQHAVRHLQRLQLLFLVGHAGRQRYKVPVHVAVALLAAEGEDVQPLGAHHSPQRLADAVDQALQAAPSSATSSWAQLPQGDNAGQ